MPSGFLPSELCPIVQVNDVKAASQVPRQHVYSQLECSSRRQTLKGVAL